MFGSRQIALWLCLLACSTACSSGERLTILSLSLEGEDSASVQRGLTFAVEELNSRDGLGGIPLRLVSLDLPASGPELQPAILEKIRQTGASVLISGSRQLSAVLLPFSGEARIPVISLTHVPDDGNTRRDWFFMNAVNPLEEARVIWRLISQLAPGGALVVPGDHPWEEEVARELVAWAGREQRTGLLTVLPRDAALPGPGGRTALVLLKPAAALPALIRTIRASGNTAPLITTSRALHPSFRLLPEAEGVACPATAIHDRLSSLTRRISDIYYSRFGREMTIEAALAYDSVMLVSISLKSARPEPDTLRSALAGETVYSSIFGTRFLPQGAHRPTPAMIPVVIRSGEAELLSTPLPGVMP